MATSLDPVALVRDVTWQLGFTLGVALVVGALGGLVPTRSKKTEPAVDPDEPGSIETPIKPWQRGLVGAVAAAAALFALEIETPLQLFCASLVAGYSGNAVLASLETRLLAVLDNASLRRQVNGLNRDARVIASHLDSIEPAGATPTNTARSEIAAIRARRGW